MKNDFIRPGFGDCHTSHALLNKLADAALLLRLHDSEHRNKPKISDVLMSTRMKHTIGAFVKRNGAACALGVICLKSGALSKNASKDRAPWWNRIWSYFDCTNEEMDRHVQCPVDNCYHSNLIISVIPHLNDTHRWSNYRIGKWLKRYKL